MMYTRDQEGRPGLFVGVAGCGPGEQTSEPVMFRTAEGVDAYFGVGDHFGAQVKRLLADGPDVVEVVMPEANEPDDEPLDAFDVYVSIDGHKIDLAGRVDMSEPIMVGEPRLPCDHCGAETVTFVGGERLCMGHTLQALVDARDGNRQRDAVIAEMTRTIAGLRGVPETVEPGYGVENLAMMGRTGR